MKSLFNVLEYLPPRDWLIDKFRSDAPVIPLPQSIVAVGHRGTSITVPENTIAAHNKAWEMGARCVEFDVRATIDNHFVVFHDTDAERMAGDKRKIKDMTLAEVKSLNVRGEDIPTLQEALKNVRGRYAVDLDFKDGPEDSAKLLGDILDFEGFGQPGAPLVTIFVRRGKMDMLESLHERYKLRPIYESRRYCRALADKGIKVKGLRRYFYSGAAARNIRQTGMSLFANAMPKDNLKTFKEYSEVGASFIQTDRLDILVPFLETIGRLEKGVPGRDFNAEITVV